MPDYTIDIEIYEGKGGELKKDSSGEVIYPEDIVGEGICAWMYRGDGERSYKVGDTFRWPRDAGKICPWLMDSMSGIIHTLRFGGKLGWQYPNTPYEKVWNKNGITTEYIRCVDPSASGIVVKIIRTAIKD